MHEAKEQLGNGTPRYETRDVTARSMVYSAIGLVLLTGMGLGASWVVMKYFVTVQKLGPPASPFDATRVVPPAPRLRVNPVETLRVYEAAEKSRLEGYGWVDPKAGIVRIPIYRAMELSLQRGFPVRRTPPKPPVAAAEARTSVSAAQATPLAAETRASGQGN